jgi:hypothetical protein
MCLERGCTPVFSHHTKKAAFNITDGSINLARLCGAGIAEFARQWIILSRNGEYDFSGQRHLFAVVGRHRIGGQDDAEGQGFGSPGRRTAFPRMAPCISIGYKVASAR